MTASRDDDPRQDRRWYPPDDPAQWARITRQAMFDAIRLCISHAIDTPTGNNALPREVYSTDEVYRKLHECAESCAHALYALGMDEDKVEKMVRAAAQEAAEPDELHPAVIATIAQWCRDAR